MKNKKGISPLGVAVAGAVVAAGAIALSKKENRDKVKSVAKKAMGMLDAKKNKVAEVVEDGKNLANDVSETASDVKDLLG